MKSFVKLWKHFKFKAGKFKIFKIWYEVFNSVLIYNNINMILMLILILKFIFI